MTQQLIINLPKTIYPENEPSILLYCFENRAKINKLCAKLGRGKIHLKEALSYARMSQTTYYRIKSFAQAGISHCEQFNINYEDTDFKDVIDNYYLIEDAKKTGLEPLVDAIFNQFDDIIVKDKDGIDKLLKRGDGNLALKMLERYDENYADRSKVDINIGNKDSSGSTGVTINLLNLTNFREQMQKDQDKLMNITKEKK